jgi:hypothetical protein
MKTRVLAELGNVKYLQERNVIAMAGSSEGIQISQEIPSAVLALV